MTEETTPTKQRGESDEALLSALQKRKGRRQRRRDKIIAEIERNRRGEYTVPTWVLTALLIALVGGFVALIVFGSSG